MNRNRTRDNNYFPSRISHSGRRVSLLTRLSLRRLTFPILIPAVFLTTIGLATFYSIDQNLFKQQALYLLVALGAYFIFLNVDYRIFGYLARYLYFIMVGLLLILFVIGIEAKGAVRWVDIFGVRIQFSEVIKPFYVIFLSYILSKDESHSFGKFIKILLLLAPIFFLTLKQPDLGNALIYFFVTVLMLFVYGFSLSYFLILGTVITLPLPILYNFLHDYQKQRILSFINTTGDPFGSSYNSIQALISIGSGGFTGKGFGQATQSILRFLPERHTDFIFATISESLGFIGGLIILMLYSFLLYQIYKIFSHTEEIFSRLIVAGFFFLILVHTFINIGMNMAVLPIVGITLPFVSYGGSSLLTNFIILGIVSSVNYEFRREKSLEIS